MGLPWGSGGCCSGTKTASPTPVLQMTVLQGQHWASKGEKEPSPEGVGRRGLESGLDPQPPLGAEWEGCGGWLVNLTRCPSNPGSVGSSPTKSPLGLPEEDLWLPLPPGQRAQEGPALQRALGRVFQGHPQSPGGEGGGAVSPRRLGQRLFGTPALLSGGLSMLPTTSRPRQPAHGPLAENAHSPADSGQAANCRLPGRPRVSTSGQVVSEDPCATTLRRAAAPTHLPASSTSSRLTRRLPGTFTPPSPVAPPAWGAPSPWKDSRYRSLACWPGAPAQRTCPDLHMLTRQPSVRTRDPTPPPCGYHGHHHLSHKAPGGPSLARPGVCTEGPRLTPGGSCRGSRGQRLTTRTGRGG